MEQRCFDDCKDHKVKPAISVNGSKSGSFSHYFYSRQENTVWPIVNVTQDVGTVE